MQEQLESFTKLPMQGEDKSSFFSFFKIMKSIAVLGLVGVLSLEHCSSQRVCTIRPMDRRSQKRYMALHPDPLPECYIAGIFADSDYGPVLTYSVKICDNNLDGIVDTMQVSSSPYYFGYPDGTPKECQIDCYGRIQASVCFNTLKKNVPFQHKQIPRLKPVL